MVKKPTKPIEKPVIFGLLDKVYIGILLVIFGGIVLHAPLTVGLGVLLPHYALIIKSWKEILMIVAGIALLIVLYRKRQWKLLTQPVILAVAGYALLYVLLVPVHWWGTQATFAGILIDLRYILYFSLVYLAIQLYPTMRRPFVIVFFAGAFVVAAFSLLQVFVLPKDILKYIGYSKATIVPYLTVDQNPQFVRINSTLRGPNPLGAYAGIVIALLFAFWLRGKQVIRERRQTLAVSVIVIGSFVALWVSYSRSALFAALGALAIVALATIGRKLPRKVWIGFFVVVFAVIGVLIAARNTNFVSNVLLHQNATTGAAVDSNQGHVTSVQDGLKLMAQQPLGGGVGSTGSASLGGTHPLIIENQFLFIAHEAGWIGLALFIYLIFLVLRGLWKQRTDWLALGVFASGIGLIFIGLLLPVWVDDTVSIIWWGLAGVALAGKGVGHDRTINKTSKRIA